MLGCAKEGRTLSPAEAEVCVSVTSTATHRGPCDGRVREPIDTALHYWVENARKEWEFMCWTGREWRGMIADWLQWSTIAYFGSWLISLVLWPLALVLLGLQTSIAFIMMVLWPVMLVPRLIANVMQLLWMFVVTLPKALYFMFVYSDLFRLLSVFTDDIHDNSFQVADSSLVKEMDMLQVTAAFLFSSSITGDGFKFWDHLLAQYVVVLSLFVCLASTTVARTGIFVCWSLARHCTRHIAKKLTAREVSYVISDQSGIVQVTSTVHAADLTNPKLEQAKAEYESHMKACLSNAAMLIVMFTSIAKLSLSLGVVTWSLSALPNLGDTDSSSASGTESLYEFGVINNITILFVMPIYGSLVAFLILQCYMVYRKYESLIHPEVGHLEDKASGVKVPQLDWHCGILHKLFDLSKIRDCFGIAEIAPKLRV